MTSTTPDAVKLLKHIQYQRRKGSMTSEDFKQIYNDLKKEHRASLKELKELKKKHTDLQTEYSKCSKQLDEMLQDELIQVIMEVIKHSLLPKESTIRCIILDHLKMAKLIKLGKQRQMKWSPKVIKFALQFAHVGKTRAYNALENHLNLPSLRRLYNYNHVESQRTGWIKDDIIRMVCNFVCHLSYVPD